MNREKRFKSLFSRSTVSFLFRLVTNNGFIPVVLSVITFLLLDFNPAKYACKVVHTEFLQEFPQDWYSFYADLNGDEIQEYFRYTNMPENNSSLVVMSSTGKVKDQWNFAGKINNRSVGFYVGDYNHNNTLEIICLSISESHIILNIVEPYGNKTQLVCDRFIDSLWDIQHTPTMLVHDLAFVDLNQDNKDEVVFAISCISARQPRKVYAYDIENDSLWSSPISGTAIDNFLIADADDDGRPEIFGCNNGSNNYSDGQIQQPDTASWYFVLDERLGYKTPPLAVGSVYSFTFPLLVKKENKSVVLIESCEARDSIITAKWNQVQKDLTLRPVESILKDKDFMPNDVKLSASKKAQLFMTYYDKCVFFVSGTEFSKYSIKGIITSSIPIYNYVAGISDIEFALFHQTGKGQIALYDRIGKKLETIEIRNYSGDYRICWCGIENGSHKFLLSNSKENVWYDVKRNPWQYLQYLILVALFGGFFGFISFIRFVQAKQIAQKDIMRRDIIEYQIKAVRNQLDPHFTFNALNTLSGLSLMGDKNGVENFISHFSRLLRNHLHTSDKVLVPLSDEIEFVVNFVELQRIRFENVFHLELDISDNIDLSILIPKMIIQTHVENAIKHGFRSLIGNHISELDEINASEARGRILIRAFETEKALVISIEDNGVGRGNSTVPKTESSGVGLFSLVRIIEAVRQLYGIQIRQEFEDLVDGGGNPLGTKVLLWIYY